METTSNRQLLGIIVEQSPARWDKQSDSTSQKVSHDVIAQTVFTLFAPPPPTQLIASPLFLG